MVLRIFLALCIVSIGVASPAGLKAQADWQISGHSIPELRHSKPAGPVFHPIRHQDLAGKETLRSMMTTSVPKVYCYDNLAFFCRLEVQVEKATKFPIKFRLGDVPYVDWLEGKRSDLSNY